MLLTRIRPALLVVACAILCGLTRADDKSAPTPRPQKKTDSSARPDDKKAPPKPVATDREQLRKELEAKFAGLAPEQTVGLLEQLAQEWGARKGAYEVAQFRFTTQVGELPRARQRLSDHKLSTATIPPVLRAADVGTAIKVAQELADAHVERVKRFEAVKAALGAVTKAGAEFAGAASAAGDHLFKMQTAAGLAKSVSADKLPAAFETKALAEAEDRLATSTREVKTGTDSAKAEAVAIEKALAEAKAAAESATAKLESLKAGQSDLTAAFDYEEKLKGMTPGALTDEFNRLRTLFAEKARAIKGDEADYKKTAEPVAEARAKFDAVKEPTPPQAETGTPGSLEAAGKRLVTAQQHLAARLRTFDERTEKGTALVAALDEQEKKALAYSTTLDELRRTAGQLAAAGAEIERRVGRGDLDPAKVPEGVAEAASATGNRAKLEAEAAALQNLLTQLRKERDALRKPDTEVEGARALVAAILANVGERIDRHTDLKKLAADYATTRATRSESEQKRMDQRAAERMAKENKEWDIALALDRSKQSADIAALLDAYYKELIELDEREDNLHRQKEALGKLVKLTQTEADNIAKLRGLVEKQLLLLNETELAVEAATKQEKLDAASLAKFNTLRDTLEAGKPVRAWDAWLAARLAPDGLKAEADAYHAETSRLNALSGSTARRVETLTGNPPTEASKTAEQTKLPANGGEIAKARNELLQARARGLIILAIKIGLVLLAALILPRLIMMALRRSIRGGTDDAGNPSPVLRPVRAVLRLIIWLSALAVILSILGYDVSAMVVAIAIGVLAVALAARPMIADVLGSVAIFTERRFKVGDVVRLGGAEPARVIGLTWRSTSLKNANGLVSSVPNRAVADALVENLSRGTDTYDTLSVTVSTDKDAGKVINVVRAAMAQCKNLSPDQGVTVVSYVQRGAVKVVQYRFWWFLKDYETRNKTRDEVFARIAVGLAHEDMTGIEIALA